MEKPKELNTESLSKSLSQKYKDKQEDIQEKQQEIILKRKEKIKTREADIQKRIEETYKGFLNPPIKNRKLTWGSENIGVVEKKYIGYYKEKRLFEIKRTALQFKLTIEDEQLLTELERKKREKIDKGANFNTSTNMYKLQVKAENIFKENKNLFFN